MTQSHFFPPATSGLPTEPRASSLPAHAGSAMDCPMSASHRPFLSAVSGVFVCALMLIAGTSCDRKASGGKALSPKPGIKTLWGEGNAAVQEERFAEALISYEKALALMKKDDSPEEWVNVATKAAQMHVLLSDWTGAGILLTKAVGVSEQHYGPEAPQTEETRRALAVVREEANWHPEAMALIRQTQAIEEASHGKDHREVAFGLTNLAMLLKKTNRPAEAEPLMRRALAIHEAFYGKSHPQVAAALFNLAQLLQDTNRMAEAELLMRRALVIHEALLGKNHPDVAIYLNSLAHLLKATNRLAEADALMQRVIAIFVNISVKDGRTDATLEIMTRNYRDLLVKMGDSEAVIEEKIGKLMEPISKK